MYIDFDSFFRSRIEGLLIRASWVGALRSMLGLEKVSQIWNGNAGWYFWLRTAPGPYALVFSEGQTIEIHGRRLFEGQFLIKCFPYPEYPGLSGFSAEERRLIGSDSFDDTHTPCFEAETGLPEWLFTVGSFALICDQEDTLNLLTYQSLDALRIRELDHSGSGAGPDRPSEAARWLRNIAGWDIGYPLFDCLVGLNCHAAGQPPAFIGLSQSEGFDYRITGTTGVELCNSSKTTQTALTFSFNSSDIGTEWIKTVWQNRLEAGESILAARRLTDSTEDAGQMDLPENIKLNPLWWKIAESDFRSELTSTCGCGRSHCHHTEHIKD
jgi:hypothetical protein